MNSFLSRLPKIALESVKFHLPTSEGQVIDCQSLFSIAGSDLVPWMMKYLDIEDTSEALHLAHLMSAHGYFFPIDDHVLTVKNDNTFYR